MGKTRRPASNANFGDFYRGQMDIGPDGSIWIATTTTSTGPRPAGQPSPAGGHDALVAGFRRRPPPSSADAPSAEVLPMPPTASRCARQQLWAFDNLQILVGGGTLSNDLPLPAGSIQPSPLGERRAGLPS